MAAVQSAQPAGVVGAVLKQAPGALKEGLVSNPGLAGDALLRSTVQEARETFGSYLQVENGVVKSGTTIRAASKPAALLEAFMGDWNEWWSLGSTTNRRVAIDGTISQDFRPMSMAGFGPVNARVNLGKPIRSLTAEGEEVFRVPMNFSRDLEGKAYMEFRGLRSGGSVLKAIWEGVRPTGLLSFWPMPNILGQGHVIVEEAWLKSLDRCAATLKRAIRI